MQHLNMTTPDGAQLNLDALYKICPSCFTESAAEDGSIKRVVDFKKLRALLGDNAEEDAPEAYDFTWVGKRAAQREAAAPIRKTLRPCPEESVDWEHTQNLYIEGDNLEVLKLLQNSYMGKVKMIYIDPPYNTGNDFVYHDDFAVSAEEYDEHNLNEEGERFRKNTDSNGRFHSDWCSMMYSRLMVARTLLKEDGVIFISIDDNEVENLRKICDEVFGESNFVATLIWQRAFSPKNDARYVSSSHDYVLMIAKQIDNFDIGRLERTEEANARYSNPDNDPRGVWMSSDISVKTYNAACDYPITTPSGKIIEPPAGRCWSLSKNSFLERLQDNRIWFGPNGDGVPRIKRFLTELKHEGMAPTSILLFKEVGHSQEGAQEVVTLFGDKGVFDGPKPVRLMQRLITLANLEDDSIVLDFFSGSASTAHALLKTNAEKEKRCKFIMVQIPEAINEKKKDLGYTTICDIAKERIRRAGSQIKSDLESKISSLESSIARMLEAKPDNMTSLLLKEDQEEIAKKLYQEQIEPKIKEKEQLVRILENLDTGFRVFKCDTSNMKDVYFSPKEYSQDLLSELEDNIKDDRTDLDLLFDCMLRWGVELSLPLASTKVGACTIHNVNDGDLVACFDGKITDEVVDAIAALKPLRVVFRDSSFTEAAQKMNLFELFKQKCGWSEAEVKNNVKVI